MDSPCMMEHTILTVKLSFTDFTSMPPANMKPIYVCGLSVDLLS